MAFSIISAWGLLHMSVPPRPFMLEAYIPCRSADDSFQMRFTRLIRTHFHVSVVPTKENRVFQHRQSVCHYL